MTLPIRLARPPRAASMLLVLALLLAACSDDAGTPGVEATLTATAAAATSVPETRNSATATAPPTVDVARVEAHLQVLAGDIGPRVAGAEGERKAARYIERVLRDAGYAATIEPFSFSGRFDDSAVALADGQVAAVMFEGSPTGSATGQLVEAGTGQPAELAAAQVRGRIVLVQRGVITFAEKVTNATAAGAVGLMIVNNEAGPFRGTLGSMRASIPVIGVSGADGPAVRAAIGREMIMKASGGSRTSESENVVGRNGDCRAYVGGHYDSVPGAPGANDNASGTALFLELARVHRVEGLCFIAFGAEEVGLRGSQAFVSQHLVGGARWMLNFDMVGRIDGPVVVGDAALTDEVLDILEQRGVTQLRAGSFPAFASSDHVSFNAAGVPAVTITTGGDSEQHTPRDTVARIERDALALMLEVGDAVLATLTKALAAAPPR